MSKVFERGLYKQLFAFFGKILSKYQCGFRKSFNAQHYLFQLLEKCRNSLDQCLVFGALLTGLSKAFDCLSHELFVAKLIPYGVEISSVRLIYDCLTNRKHRTKTELQFLDPCNWTCNCHKDQLQVHCFLIFIYVTCFSYLKICT